jgi:hypothetical protein
MRVEGAQNLILLGAEQKTPPPLAPVKFNPDSAVFRLPAIALY